MHNMLYSFDQSCVTAFHALVKAWSGDVAVLAVSCAGMRVRIAARATASASCMCPYCIALRGHLRSARQRQTLGTSEVGTGLLHAADKSRRSCKLYPSGPLDLGFVDCAKKHRAKRLRGAGSSTTSGRSPARTRAPGRCTTKLSTRSSSPRKPLHCAIRFAGIRVLLCLERKMIPFPCPNYF